MQEDQSQFSMQMIELDFHIFSFFKVIQKQLIPHTDEWT